ncbi:SCP2 sterol-binding domain-containing protein [Protomyces lactucae-debilis]|uniref:SCP2 sterol-binding domain-containing protein n=1 Tax=Protomyces lactucae-debilis TaxID=2754530 RepID=A0A1Y2FK20_PROLT|nr:SCP2 sterol-binding domain-containing protein [Protomyces lactucae-debilis]ORY84321.1 SCP2 sterol-binding domain-containing protein [Protomyces lactucae-debilis]
MSSAKELFATINEGLSDEAVRKPAIKKTNAIFSFDFKSGGKYYIDLKETGKAGEGAAPAGKKADITMTMDEKTFLDLASGKGNAQKLFMQGKIKIKGNMMKATALGDVLKTAQAPKAKI